MRPKFEFADGLRAVAALSVAVLHATTFTGHLGDMEGQFPAISKIISLANYAVPVFITLSGYVLMLPVARTEDYSLRGVWKYIWRRAKRILPPYYAALIIFGLMIALVPALQDGHNTAWENNVPVALSGAISHVFLVHNWSPAWIYQIDGPAWSVATEWHIYFIMPLVLLPLCRWLNPAAMLVVALALRRRTNGRRRQYRMSLNAGTRDSNRVGALGAASPMHRLEAGDGAQWTCADPQVRRPRPKG